MKRAAVALALLASAFAAQAQACAPHPLGGRDLYLRGSFNAWNAPEAQRFVWACDRFELVTALAGEHRFKVGDEGWSADVDGRPAEVLRANGLFRAVRLSAGEHRVRFRYLPWSARAGAVASLLGAVAALATLLASARGMGATRPSA